MTFLTPKELRHTLKISRSTKLGEDQVPCSPPVVVKYKTLEERAHAHVKSGLFSKYAQEWDALGFYRYRGVST